MKKLVALAALVCVLALVAGGATAATKTWNVSSGNWNTSGSWTPTGIPVAGDEVKQTKAGGKCTIPSGYSTANIYRVYIYNATIPTITVTGTLNMATGNFIKVGFGSTASNQNGRMIQTGTVAAASTPLILGDGYTSRYAAIKGWYNLNSGTLTCGEIQLGYRGASGYMYQAGGSTNVGLVTVGYDTSNNDCLYSLTSGTLTCTGMAVTRGALTVSQSATCDINGNMTVGGTGTLNAEISSGDNTYVDVSGNVTISSGSTLNVSLLGGFTPSNNQEFTIIQSTGGGAISGTFSNVTSGWSNALRDSNTRLVAIYSPAPEPTKAFPGAYGFGCQASGGRGGSVYKVTNLNNSGSGSFRDCVKNDNGTVIFDTGGTVTLATRLNVYNSNVTVAGQTAPGGGFCVRNGVMYIRNFENWIIRHMRFRLGRHSGTSEGSENQFDSMTITNGVNVIVDHCSFSWGCDENVDIKDLSNNLTIQWCILTEPLNFQGHGYELILEPNGIANTYMTLHHNLFANQLGRNPRGSNEYGAILWENINNVAYNWGGTEGDWGAWACCDSSEHSDLNWVGNYSIAGPNSGNTPSTMLSAGTTNSRIYIGSTNYIDSDRDTSHDGVAATWSNVAGSKTQMGSPFSIPTAYQVATDTADTAYTNVLAGAGATKPSRDSVDTRAVNSVTNRNGSIINDEDDVGGWPTLAAGTPPTDTDGDGMPDAWETAYGTNPNVADNNGDLDGDGYTNLEEYINSL
jgi:hypothetical protein